MTRRVGGGALRALRLALAGAGTLVALAACAAPSFEEYAERPGLYDELTPIELSVMREARRLAAAGDLDLARRRLSTLCAAIPGNLAAATALQDVELRMLEAGLALPGPGKPDPSAEPGDTQDPIARLYADYAERAEAYGTVAGAVLAARLAPDAETAAGWLARALADDPNCVWAHHGSAWLAAEALRFTEAWEHLERALRLDPGHPAARRLEAQLLTRRGELELATDAWRAWIRHFGDDPRVAPRDEAAAHMELAHLLVQRGKAEEALATLDTLARLRDRFAGPGLDAADAVDAEMVRVVALDAMGRVGEALSVVRAAADAAPLDPRPRVQEALLLSDRLGDEEGARRAWEDVLARLDEAPEGVPSGRGADPAAGELTAILTRLQANAALARLGPAPAPDPIPVGGEARP